MNIIKKLGIATEFLYQLEALLRMGYKRDAIEMSREYCSSECIDCRQCDVVLKDIILGERDVSGFEVEYITGGCCYHILRYLASCEENYLNQILGYSWYHNFKVVDKLFDYEELKNMKPFASDVLFNTKFGHGFVISVEKRDKLLEEMNGWVNLSYLNGISVSVELVNGNINNATIELAYPIMADEVVACNASLSGFAEILLSKAKHSPNILTKGAVEHAVNEYISELLWTGLGVKVMKGLSNEG